MKKLINKDIKWSKWIYTCSAHSLGLLLIRKNRKIPKNECDDNPEH